MEIRIHVMGEWRVIYVAKFEDAVDVLHSFKKRAGKQVNKILTWSADDTSK